MRTFFTKLSSEKRARQEPSLWFLRTIELPYKCYICCHVSQVEKIRVPFFHTIISRKTEPDSVPRFR
jgi:hypothetical protein